jgi:hypothetical protein
MGVLCFFIHGIAGLVRCTDNTLVLPWLSNSPLLESGCMACGLNTLLASNHDTSERAFVYHLKRLYYKPSSSLTSIRIDFYSK